MQLLVDDGEQVRAGRDVAVLAQQRLELLGAQQHDIAAADIAKVVYVKRKRLHPALERAQVFLGRVEPEPTVGQPQALDEPLPREDLRIALSHVGEDMVDVLLEHGVGREQVDLVGTQILALLVEQVGDALQEHRGLAGAGDAVDDERGHVCMAHDLVLLLLDSRRDGRELFGMALGQRLQKQRVFDGDGGIEVGVELVAGEVELPAQLEVDLFNLVDLIDHSGQFIQVCHPEDYTMVFANELTRMVSGHPELPYQGKRCYEYMLGADGPCGYCPMNQMGDEAEKTV